MTAQHPFARARGRRHAALHALLIAPLVGTGLWMAGHRVHGHPAPAAMSAPQALSRTADLLPRLSASLVQASLVAEPNMRWFPGMPEAGEWRVDAVSPDGAQAGFVWRADTGALVYASLSQEGPGPQASACGPLQQGVAVESAWQWVCALGLVRPGEQWTLEGRPTRVGQTWRVTWSGPRPDIVAAVRVQDGELTGAYTVEFLGPRHWHLQEAGAPATSPAL